MRVNGFDERLGYGGLDRELGERLFQAGVRPWQIRHRAVCVHLDHSRSYVDPAIVAQNRAIREENRQRRVRWTPFGIDQSQPAEGWTISDIIERRNAESERQATSRAAA